MKGAFRRLHSGQQQQKQLKQQMFSEEGENQSVIQLDFDSLGSAENEDGSKGSQSAWSLLIVPFRRTSHKSITVGQLGPLMSGDNNSPNYSP